MTLKKICAALIAIVVFCSVCLCGCRDSEGDAADAVRKYADYFNKRDYESLVAMVPDDVLQYIITYTAGDDEEFFKRKAEFFLEIQDLHIVTYKDVSVKSSSNSEFDSIRQYLLASFGIEISDYKTVSFSFCEGSSVRSLQEGAYYYKGEWYPYSAIMIVAGIK